MKKLEKVKQYQEKINSLRDVFNQYGGWKYRFLNYWLNKIYTTEVIMLLKIESKAKLDKERNKLIKEKQNLMECYTQATEEMSASEALYGFMGWLTTREEVTPKFSATHGATEAAALVNRFCKTNKLKEPRSNWEHYLTHPVQKTKKPSLS